MSEDWKMAGPIIVTFLVAVLVMSNYFISGVPMISSTVGILRNLGILLTAFAIGLGAANLLIVNYNYFSKRTPGLWPFGLLMIIGLPAVTVLGVVKHPLYNWIYTNMTQHLVIAIGSLLGVFIVSAIYRVYKVRNIESLLVTVSTLVVLLRNAPIGGIIWSGFPIMGDWLLFVMGVGGIRALLIVAAFGIVSMGIRTILGYERTFLGELAGIMEE